MIEAAVLPLIGASPSKLILVDPPFHANIGDSLILVGELDFLRRHYPRTALSYVEPRSYSQRSDAEIARADVILIHGGGNFGDLYPLHHNFRKRVIERFAEKPIVQLPQTLEFKDPEEVRHTAQLIKRTRDFTLLVRDTKSLNFAQENFDCPVKLVPDMGYAANPLARGEPLVDIVAHLRKDKEAVYDHDAFVSVIAASQRTHIVEDWPSDRHRWSVHADRKFGRLIRAQPALARWPGLALREYCARQRVMMGQRTLSRGRRVITDRLHGHIFCEMMGIKHCIFDSYGNKLRRFHQTWSSQSALATQVDSPEALADYLQS